MIASRFRTLASTSTKLSSKLLVPKTLTASAPRVFLSSPVQQTSFSVQHNLSVRTMASKASTFLKFAEERRSYYALNKDLTISKSEVEDIVKEAIKQVPSSFNSQSNRAVVLFGAEHEKLWDIVESVLKPIVPAANWEPTGKKIAGFKAAAGSVLFFVEENDIKELQEKFALYADRFPPWGEHTSAILQFAVWTALEAAGLGANLQHYNPLIDEKVAAEWNIPKTWKLVAHLNFGGRAGEAGPKDFKPIDTLFKSYGN